MMDAEETLRLARKRWPKLFAKLDAMKAAEEAERRAAQERSLDEQFAGVCSRREQDGRPAITRSMWLSGCFEEGADEVGDVA